MLRRFCGICSGKMILVNGGHRMSDKRILTKIKETIKKYNMIGAGDGIVVGLSGGPDSVCLFHALCVLRSELGAGEITAVHINHGMRGAESDGDEESARRLAESMDAEFISFKYDVPRIAAEAGEGTEEAGRRLRYDAFERVRRQKGAARIAVAHNMNDQAETVLMRIMRGTGIKGLAGIDFIRRDGIVIRPLLALSRDEIEQYCSANGLAPRIDSTNTMAVYTRNKIRLELLPLMQEKFNPNVVEALVRLSAQAREDEDYIMSAALGYTDKCELPINDMAAAAGAVARWDASSCSLRLDGFDDLHVAVAKRVIMLCAERAGMKQNMSAVNLSDVLRLAENAAEGKETDLADGFYARVSYGRLWFLRRAGDAAEDSVALPVDELMRTGSADIMYDGHMIKMKLCAAAECGPPENTAGAGRGMYKSSRGAAGAAGQLIKLRLDFDLIIAKKNVVIRHRMPGDRIRPLGMKGSKKLQDYFVDRKIPKHMRDEAVLIVSAGRVIAAGSEVTAECPVNAETKQILSIEY